MKLSECVLGVEFFYGYYRRNSNKETEDINKGP